MDATVKVSEPILLRNSQRIGQWQPWNYRQAEWGGHLHALELRPIISQLTTISVDWSFSFCHMCILKDMSEDTHAHYDDFLLIGAKAHQKHMENRPNNLNCCIFMYLLTPDYATWKHMSFEESVEVKQPVLESTHFLSFPQTGSKSFPDTWKHLWDY